MTLKEIKLAKFIAFLFLVFFVFSYGIGVGFYGWIPFGQIRLLKNTFISGDVHPQTVNVSLNIIERNATDLRFIRQNLIKAIAPPQETMVSIERSDQGTVISTRYYGVSVNGVLTKSSESQSRCLRIYVQGHGGNPFDFEYHKDLLERFVNNGCDVLFMSMIGLGLNSGNASFPARFGEIDLTPSEAGFHGNFSFFYDRKNPQIDPLSLFLYPHMQIIKKLLAESPYDDNAVLGISNGGWYAVWLATLMPNLQTSISYAGSLPLPYRKYLENHGDWEQVYSKLYDYVSYLDLYQLMVADDNGQMKRSAYLVYNDNDTCCFMNPYASHFQNAINNNSNFPVIVIDEMKKHAINLSLIDSIFNDDK